MNDFSKILKDYREKYRLSREKTAELLNVSTTTILMWERGEHSPQKKNMENILSKLNNLSD